MSLEPYFDKTWRPGEIELVAAVKVLPPTLAGNQAFVQQFRQDMQFISGLEHAHILPVYDFGQQADLLYIVSRFIDTGTLQDRLSQYYIPARAEQLIRPIAQALDYMHSRGAVHGNIKPANILLDAQGQPLLTDFGYPFINPKTLKDDLATGLGLGIESIPNGLAQGLRRSG